MSTEQATVEDLEAKIDKIRDADHFKLERVWKSVLTFTLVTSRTELLTRG